MQRSNNAVPIRGVLPYVGANQDKVEAPHLLSGWKDIANYLGKGVRTVQRYECELGLPVRRPAGMVRGSVMATKAEIDAWVAASPMREAFLLITPSGSVASDTTAIRSGLREMAGLRDQMKPLRLELRTSVRLLKERVHALQGELNQNRESETTDAKSRKAN